jgi:hypothetical protein
VRAADGVAGGPGYARRAAVRDHDRGPARGERARAYAASGDPLAEDPLCVHRPGSASAQVPTRAPAPRAGR